MGAVLLERKLLRRRLRALQGIYLAQTYAIVLTRILAYSWLLEELGSRQLPWVFLFQAIPVCVLTFALIGVVDRVGRASLLTAGAFAFGCGILLAYVGASAGIPSLSPVFLLFGETAISLFGAHFWLLTSELLSPEQSKRHFPSLALVGAVGAILAGLSVQFIPARAPQDLLLLLLPSLCVSGGVAWHLHRSYPYRVGPRQVDHAVRGWHQELNEGMVLMKQTPLLRSLILLTAAITCSGVIIDYLYTVTVEGLEEVTYLPAFFGGINIVINMLQIILVLSMGSRIFTTFGLFRTLSSFPAGGLALSLTGLLGGTTGPMLALKVFDRLENYIVLNPGVGIALNAFDKERRGRTSLVFGGLIKPLSISLTGLCLLLVSGFYPALVILTIIMALFFVLLRHVGKVYRETLIKNLYSKDPRLINNSIEALAESENRHVAPTLLAFYAHTADTVFSENVLMAAGRIKDPRFVPILLEALTGTHVSLKCAAVRSLAQFKSEDVRQALLSALQEEDSARVKASILSALSFRFDSSVHYPVLLAGLDDPDPRVQANAVEALGLTQDPRLIVKARCCLDSEHPRVKANAVIALSKVRSERERALTVLNEFFDTEDRALWLSGIHAAGEVGEPALVDLLRLAAGSPDPDIHRNAVIALGKHDDLSSVEPLTRLLIGPAGQGIPVAHALDRFGESVREAVIARLSALSPSERARAVQVLKTCGVNYPELVEQLEFLRPGGTDGGRSILLDTVASQP